MPLSSRSAAIHRDKSPSLSPLSPTVIHYRQKYPIQEDSHNHRTVRRDHHGQETRIVSSFRQYHHSPRTSRANRQQQSASLWEVHQSSNGRLYYYNRITDQSQWEKPAKEQLIIKKDINTDHGQSKRSKNNNDHVSVSHHYERDLIDHSKNSKRFSSNRISNSDKSNFLRQSHNDHRHKRKKNNTERQLSSKKARNEVIFPRLTPTSPPPNEIIRVDLVDPILTASISITHISLPTPLINENIFKNDSYKTFSIKLNSMNIESLPIMDFTPTPSQPPLRPSVSTINAILELEYSPPVVLPVKHQSSPPTWSTMSNSNSGDITRYYRGELIEHLLNWPSTQIEREANRLLNEQAHITIRQLTSLRTDIYCTKLRFQRNRFQLLQNRYTLAYQSDLINTLDFIDQDSQY